MKESEPHVLFKSRVDNVSRRAGYGAEFKRRIVAESFAPGASVRLIARHHAVSESALNKWRLIYGEQSSKMVDAASVPEIAGMLPIHVVDEPSPQPSPSSMNKRVDSDLCEVEFDRARLRIRGQVCPTTLRLLIQELSQ